MLFLLAQTVHQMKSGSTEGAIQAHRQLLLMRTMMVTVWARLMLLLCNSEMMLTH